MTELANGDLKGCWKHLAPEHGCEIFSNSLPTGRAEKTPVLALETCHASLSQRQFTSSCSQEAYVWSPSSILLGDQEKSHKQS
eukprot:1103808-Pelagomonas_calceolata.AAC.8